MKYAAGPALTYFPYKTKDEYSHSRETAEHCIPCGMNLESEHSMLTAYIQSAMRHATYEILDDQTFYGEIAGFQGVYANADTLEQCREELQSVLEGWIILGLRMDHPLLF